MKNNILIIFLLTSIAIFSQKRITKKFETNVKEMAISTLGLDDFVIENSNSNFIEITLFAENPNEQHIIFEEKYNQAIIEFKTFEQKPKEEIFRKFITKRLERASAIVKVPKNIAVSIYGDNINITSKNCTNNFTINIEQGIVKLHTIQKNITLKMYTGTVYADISKVNAEINSTVGKISIDEKIVEKNYEKKDSKNSSLLSIKTIKGIIFLTTK